MAQPIGPQGAPNRADGTPSFAAGPNQAVQSAGTGRQYAPVRAGIGGVGNAQPSRTPGGDFTSASQATATTVASIMKFGEKLIAPHLERMETEAYVNGMNRAIQGETLAEIIDSKPWYTRIFGDGAMVEGARAYAVQAAVTDQANFALESMPKLRERPTADVAQEMANRLQEYRTGDPGTDAMLLKALTDNIPQVLQQHTKEHYAWQQERHVSNMTHAAMASGKQLQQFAQDPKATPDQIMASRDRYLAAITPPEGMHPKSYESFVASMTLLNAQQGNWFAVKHMKDMGLVDRLPPDAQLQVNGSLRPLMAAEKARIQNGPMQADWTEFQMAIRGPGADPQAIREQGERLNRTAQEYYGLPEPLIDVAESMVQGGLVKWRGEQSAAGQFDYAAAREGALQSLIQGNGGAAFIGSRVPDDNKPEVFREALSAIPEEQRMRWIAANASAPQGEYVDKHLRATFKSQATGLTATEYRPQVQAAYAQYKALKDSDPSYGPAAVRAYYDPEIVAAFDQYGTNLLTMPPELAHAESFGRLARAPLNGEMSQDQEKRFRAAFKADVGGPWYNLFGSNPSDSQMEVMMAYLKPYAAKQSIFQYAMTDKEYAESMVRTAKAEGLEVIGSEYVVKRENGIPPFTDRYPNRQAFDKAFTRYVDSGMAALGITGDSRVVTLDATVGTDNPRFFAMGNDENGEPRVFTFFLNELRTDYDALLPGGTQPVQEVDGTTTLPGGAAIFYRSPGRTNPTQENE